MVIISWYTLATTEEEEQHRSGSWLALCNLPSFSVSGEPGLPSRPEGKVTSGKNGGIIKVSPGQVHYLPITEAIISAITANDLNPFQDLITKASLIIHYIVNLFIFKLHLYNQ